MTEPREAQSTEDRFIAHLEELAERDRGALAALRRGLGREPGTVAQMHPYVVRWLPRQTWKGVEEAYYLVASLFSLHPPRQPRTERRGASFASSLADLARRVASTGPERRMIAMLNCHVEDLPEHLRQSTSLLRSHEIQVDWAQLLRDLKNWEHPDKRVQRRWARDFWGRLDQEPASEADENDGGYE